MNISFKFLISLCFLSLLSSCGKSGGSISDVSVIPITVSLSTPSPISGDSTTSFVFSLTYASADTINLIQSNVSAVTTGTASCSVVSVLNGSSATPSISLSGCSGDGTLKFNITSGTATNSSGGEAEAITTAEVKIYTCPSGYITVQGLAPYTTEAFCIMKYQAKNDGGGNAISQEATAPWSTINRNDAITECQNLGAAYDLPTNDEWQTLARNIELVDSNWSGASVGSGCIFQGNNGQNDVCGYNGVTLEAGAGRDSKASLSLDTGEVIWDASGNVWTWVKDDILFLHGTDPYISTMGELYGNEGPLGMPKYAFGPSGDYTSHTVATNYAGLGWGYINYLVGGTLARGGDWTNTDQAGVFAALMSYNTSFAHADIGFRCAWHP